MGLFDFLKSNKKNKDLGILNNDIRKIQEKNMISGNEIIAYFDSLPSLGNIFELLWFKDGKYKNYEPQSEILFRTELFEVTFSAGDEPSLLSSKLSIDTKTTIDPKESIGYCPSYKNMSTGQRWIYLNWLKDVTQQVDIGYVFVFYYGLERHLIHGDYQKAVDMIMFLRKYHSNSSFMSYSASALIFASILHKDERTLKRIIESIDINNGKNDLLIAKYIMKFDLTIEEILSLSTDVGFKNKNYIKNYPELFSQTLANQLEQQFGKNTFPFYNLDTSFNFEKSIIFANTSLYGSKEPSIPSIIDNIDFKNSLYSLLSNTHEQLKIQLKELRKSGTAPEPIQKSVLSKNNCVKMSIVCPYCDETIDTAPKQKKKCSHCNNYIYVRSSKLLFPSKYLTYGQAIATDEFYGLKALGITKRKFLKKLDDLDKVSKVETNPINVCLSFYNDLIEKEKDKFELKLLYSQLALLQYKLGNDFFKSLQSSIRMELLDYQQNGIEKVKIDSYKACEKCQLLDGKVLIIDEALSSSPIPCPECTKKIKNGAEGWCTCRYRPFFDELEIYEDDKFNQNKQFLSM